VEHSKVASVDFNSNTHAQPIGNLTNSACAYVSTPAFVRNRALNLWGRKPVVMIPGERDVDPAIGSFKSVQPTRVVECYCRDLEDDICQVCYESLNFGAEGYG